MPNTYVSQSSICARLFWLSKLMTGASGVAFQASGKTRRRYYVAWA